MSGWLTAPLGRPWAETVSPRSGPRTALSTTLGKSTVQILPSHLRAPVDGRAGYSLRKGTALQPWRPPSRLHSLHRLQEGFWALICTRHPVSCLHSCLSS